MTLSSFPPKFACTQGEARGGERARACGRSAQNGGFSRLKYPVVFGHMYVAVDGAGIDGVNATPLVPSVAIESKGFFSDFRRLYLSVGLLYGISAGVRCRLHSCAIDTEDGYYCGRYLRRYVQHVLFTGRVSRVGMQLLTCVCFLQVVSVSVLLSAGSICSTRSRAFVGVFMFYVGTCLQFC